MNKSDLDLVEGPLQPPTMAGPSTRKVNTADYFRPFFFPTIRWSRSLRLI